ncbi:DUF4926 domain-containing protein [Arhodomonas sp. KWT]|uniref:DUF4926 domain-containing protein n=1 Tax=Arhodomonas sp. KWT TaxID=2679915 RepID=UPI0035300954
MEVLDVPETLQDLVSKGDMGTIVLVHNAHEFEVESVNGNGSTKWQCALPRECLRYVPNPSTC